MPSRRDFLKLASASAIAAPFAARLGAQPAISMPVPGVLGLELYSVRHRMGKDVPAALKVRVPPV